MPRVVALEWDHNELRVAVARIAGRKITVEQIVAVLLADSSSDRESSQDGNAVSELGHEQLVVEKLKELVSAGKVPRGPALLSIDRNSVEMRTLTLPPAPDEELPQLVRFQAQREFNNLEPDWPLDFLPLAGNAEEPREVIAAALDADVLRRLCSVCEQVELKPERICIRSAAMAGLVLHQQGEHAPAVELVVDLAGDTADLTLIADRLPVIMRRAKLHDDPLRSEEARADLASQIRRTLVAVHNQLGGRSVDKILLCGRGTEYEQLSTWLQSALDAAVELFDPLAVVPGAEKAGRSVPAAARFGALLGMLVDEAEERRPFFDFLNVRKAVEPVAKRNTAILAGAAVLLALVALILFCWQQERRLKYEINRLQATSRNQDAKLAELTKLKTALEQLENWEKADTVWLEQLRWLAEHFPDPEDAMLTKLTFNLSGEQPEIVWEGRADDTEAINRFEQRLRDEQHIIAVRSKTESTSGGHYGYEFRGSIYIAADKSKQTSEPQPSQRSLASGGTRP